VTYHARSDRNARLDLMVALGRTRHRLTNLFAIAFLLVIASHATEGRAQTAPAKGPTAEEILTLNRAVVIVTTFDKQDRPLLQGSGFFIGKDCIVTNMHVIREAEHIRITTFEGQTRTVLSVLAANDKDDLALLKVDRSSTDNRLELEDLAPVEGQQIIVVSNPQGSYWKITRGQVGLLWEFGGNSSRIQISAPIFPGSSGGPVVNEQGRVVGVVAMHIPSDTDLNFAVPVESLKALMNISTTFASNRGAAQQ
jgi:S1-C subfamily serine protease